MLIYNKNDLKQFVDARRKRFWKIPYENEDLSNKIRNIYQRTNLIQIIMLANVIPVIEIYILGAYFHPDNPFIFASNIFVKSTIMEIAVLFGQYYFISIIIFIVIGYDFLYLSLCTELRIQVKLLKYKLTEVFTKTSRDAVHGVWICVSYHNFLLS